MRWCVIGTTPVIHPTPPLTLLTHVGEEVLIDDVDGGGAFG